METGGDSGGGTNAPVNGVCAGLAALAANCEAAGAGNGTGAATDGSVAGVGTGRGGDTANALLAVTAGVVVMAGAVPSFRSSCHATSAPMATTSTTMPAARASVLLPRGVLVVAGAGRCGERVGGAVTSSDAGDDFAPVGGGMFATDSVVGAGDGTGAGVGVGVGVGAKSTGGVSSAMSNGWPHTLQKRAPARRGALHLGQLAAGAAGSFGVTGSGASGATVAAAAAAGASIGAGAAEAPQPVQKRAPSRLA